MNTTTQIESKKLREHLDDDVRIVLVHSKITEQLVKLAMKNTLIRKDPKYSPMQRHLQALGDRLESFEKGTTSFSSLFDAVPDFTVGKLCDVSEVTDFIIKSEKSPTDQITLLTNKSWHKAEMQKCWMTAGGDQSKFDEWYRAVYP